MEKIKELGKEIDASYFEVSAKNLEGVPELLEAIL